MLLAAIDENHSGTYDFLYLPIDFKVYLRTLNISYLITLIIVMIRFHSRAQSG